jgi:hypothetical protein
METLKGKQTVIAVIILLVIVLLVGFGLGNRKESSQDSSENTETLESGNTIPTSNKSPSANSGGSKTTTSTTSSGTLSRSDALAKYDGRIVRITDECTGDSRAHTFNLVPGTVIMIDNDANTANTIKLPGRTLTLAAHHYTLETINLGGSVSSTCNVNTRVTTVTVS